MLPGCSGVTVCSSRDQALWYEHRTGSALYPRGYSARAPISRHSAKYIKEVIQSDPNEKSLSYLQSPPAALAYVHQWLERRWKSKLPVIITLRESSYWTDRNSRIEAWAAFASRLAEDTGFVPVFVRDTERAFGKVPDCLKKFAIFSEASFDLELRSALYEVSFLNLMVSNGPAVMCLYNSRVRYIMFKVTTETAPSTTKHALLEELGLHPGEQFPGSTPYQRWAWRPDNYEDIQEEFEAMCSRIERHHGVQRAPAPHAIRNRML
jgi:hypothetical protein